MTDRTQIIADEIANDPLSRGYAAMSDEQVADSMNAVNRTVNTQSVSVEEIADAFVVSELNLMTLQKEIRLWNRLALSETIDVNNQTVIDMLTDSFPAPGAPTNGQTLPRLNALKTQTVSRGDELGVGFVAPGHVIEARLRNG